MDVGRLVVDGLGDDVRHEPDDGRVLVDVRLGVPLRLRGDVALVAVLEGARADAEILDDELVDPLRNRQVPDERPRREGPQPVGHRRVGKPGAGQVERGRRRRLRIAVGPRGRADPDRDDLEIVDEAGRQEPAGPGVGLEVCRNVESRRLGGQGQGRILVNPERREEHGEPVPPRRLEHRLALLLGQAGGDGFREKLLLGRGHGTGSARRRSILQLVLQRVLRVGHLARILQVLVDLVLVRQPVDRPLRVGGLLARAEHVRADEEEELRPLKRRSCAPRRGR